MAQRALLIGSETYGLAGCNADVALMREALARLGFDDVVERTGPDASRRGIIGSYERLIDTAVPGDAVVVYYSGHGGRVALPDWEERQAQGQEPFLQYIVPHDMAATTASDFRGVLSVELSALQERLSARAPNMTTILDCCHSGLMSRDALLIPKAISLDFPREGALDRLAELERGGFSWATDGNPNAVRVVACAPSQSAFEGPSASRPGERHGLLTDALADLLTAPSAPRLSWQTIVDRLRTSVSIRALTQRPEVEGPSQRIIFTIDEDRRAGILPVRVTDNRAWLDAAELLGVSPGDCYTLLDSGQNELAAATVGPIDNGEAELTAEGQAADITTATAAVPLRTSTRLSVTIGVADPLLAQALETAIEASPALTTATTAPTPAIGSITARHGGLRVADEAGLLLHREALPADEAGVEGAVALMEHLASAHRFRALQPTDDSSRLAASVQVTISRYDDDGKPAPLVGSGERLFIGDRLSVTVRNLSPDPLYWWLFDVGTDATIALVTQASPSGRELAAAGQPGDATTFGGPEGPGLVWPDSLPHDGGRPETFVVIVSDRAQDLSPLRTRGEPAEDSPLQRELDAARTGVRNWTPEAPGGRAQPMRYRVDLWDVILEPGPRPRLDEPRFALDQRPDVTLRMLTPRGGERPPDKVAVRLVALSVLRNHALFRATVRLDAMVITGDGQGGAIGTPLTQRFPAIASGDLLPMDNLLLYVGPVREFLDLAIWVNRDDAKGAGLADLFATEVVKPEVKAALTVVGGLVIAAPTVAVGVGAVVAVAELVRVGAQLVRMAVGDHIGLYRTSLLPYERFGVGRHPPAGMAEAQQIQFAWEVIEQP